MERSRFFNLQSDFYTYSFPKFCSMFLKFKQKIKIMELLGVEPRASCMLSKRSTNWAITPCRFFSLLLKQIKNVLL